MSSRKRPRQSEPAASDVTTDNKAECPFSAQVVDPNEKSKKGSKRRRTTDNVVDDPDVKLQQSPFEPRGSFKTHKKMDVHYRVDPPKRWTDMTRYNSFVLNNIKYFSDQFIFVANDASIDRQKALASSEGKSSNQPLQRSADDWVAKILEIRASDEHHVYARVFWMYWPAELPKGTRDGGKLVSGRQPYHGTRELVASNHMDIINVVSVTSQATVNHWQEEDDDEVQENLYWRQALDIRTGELSSLLPICKCNKPSNPDEELVGCDAEGCRKWMHKGCIRHEALMRVYNELGADKPHVSADKTGEEDKPVAAETSAAAGANADSAAEAAAAAKDDDTVSAAANGDAPATGKKSAETEEKRGSETPVPGSSSRRGVARPAKTNGVASKSNSNSDKPYEGLFDVEIVLDPHPVLNFKDLREGVEGGDREWTEPIACLICGTQLL